MIDPGHNGSLDWRIEPGQPYGLYSLSWKHGPTFAPPDLFVTLVISKNDQIEPPTVYIKTKYIDSANESLVTAGGSEQLTVDIVQYKGIPYYLGLARGYGEADYRDGKLPVDGLEGQEIAAIYRLTAVAPTQAPPVLTSLAVVGAINMTLADGQLYYANDNTQQWEPVSGQQETRLGFYAMVRAPSAT
jgi:hypothetical protein